MPIYQKNAPIIERLFLKPESQLLQRQKPVKGHTYLVSHCFEDIYTLLTSDSSFAYRTFRPCNMQNNQYDSLTFCWSGNDAKTRVLVSHIFNCFGKIRFLHDI